MSLKRDTLAMMSSRDSARKNGNHGQYKRLRNLTKSLVKRDKVQGVISLLKTNPGPQNTWNEAKTLLGRRHAAKLSECTTNSDPKTTAEYQNQFFVEKVTNLLSRLSTDECEICGESFSCKQDLVCHAAATHEGKKSLKCDICNKYFETEQDLSCHIGASHEGKKSLK